MKMVDVIVVLDGGVLKDIRVYKDNKHGPRELRSIAFMRQQLESWGFSPGFHEDNHSDFDNYISEITMEINKTLEGSGKEILWNQTELE